MRGIISARGRDNILVITPLSPRIQGWIKTYYGLLAVLPVLAIYSHAAVAGTTCNLLSRSRNATVFSSRASGFCWPSVADEGHLKREGAVWRTYGWPQPQIAIMISTRACSRKELAAISTFFVSALNRSSCCNTSVYSDVKGLAVLLSAAVSSSMSHSVGYLSWLKILVQMRTSFTNAL